MLRLTLLSLTVLFLFSSLAVQALSDECPEDATEVEVSSGELMEHELEAGESIWYFYSAEYNEVWRYDIEASDTLLFSFHDPDPSAETGFYLDFSIRVERLITATRSTLAGLHCVEVRNQSDAPIHYELTMSRLETVDGLLENVEGLDSFGNNVVGVHYYVLGNYELALEFYALSIDQNPQDHRVWNNSCDTLRELADHDEALKFCLGALELEADYGPYHHDLGLIYQLMGDYNSAEEAFEQAIAFAPRSPEAFFSLAANYVFQDEPQDALTAFDDYVQWSSDWYAPYWRGLGYLNAGDYEEAIENIQAAIDAEEVEPSLYHLWLGIAYLANGDEDEAEAAFETGEALFEDESGLTLNRILAFYAVFNQETEEAQEYYSDTLPSTGALQLRNDIFYLTVLSNVFPEEASYAEMRDWLAGELGID